MSHSTLDIFWIVVASGLVFVMQAGFAMVEAGMTRSKNSINVAVKNLTDLGISTLCFWLVGFGLMFGASPGGWLSGLVGASDFLFDPAGGYTAAFFLFQIMFCSTSATIVSGAIAERMRFSAYILSTIVLSLLIYPVFGHWAWGGAMEGQAGGWLARLGFVDFAGSTVVHSMGGWISLALLFIIGSRNGRFNPDGTANPINGSSIPLSVLGVMLLWFGWFGFNGGSTLAASAAVPGILINTTLGGAAGMVGALLLGWLVLKKPDIGMVLNGSLAGLVAITAGCHSYSPGESALVGLVGAALMLGATVLLERLRIDDAVGAVPVHLAAGVWGTLAVGLFGDPAILKTGLGQGSQLLAQLAGIGACGLWAFGSSFVLLKLLDKVFPLRVSAAEEHIGLNKAEHGVSTEILDFYQVLHRQSETGELSLRAPVEPFTEIGQIATIYNSVMDKLQVARNEYVSILSNVSDGLFLIDREGKVGGQYSAALEDILERRDLGGSRFVELLEHHLPPAALQSTRDFLELTFDKDKPFRMIERFNPLCDAEFAFASADGDARAKHLQFLFKRIEGDAQVNQIMVLVRDVTKQKELAIEIEETRQKTNSEMELFYKILFVEPEMLAQFLEGARQDVASINQTLADKRLAPAEVLKAIFRHAHAIKGDADMLGLDIIAGKAQELETGIAETAQKPAPESDDFLSLVLMLNDLKTAVDRIADVVGKWTVRRGDPDGGAVRDSLGSALDKLAQRVAARHGKRVALDCDLAAALSLQPEKRKKVQDILVQLVRNSVYHGIETPEERLRKGKPAAGAITIAARREGGNLRVNYADDGQGLDVDKIRRKAIQNKLVTAKEAEAMSERDVHALIFKPNFSTADEVGTSAGRGVGMDLVRQLLRDLGGRLTLASRRNASLRFELQLPAGEADHA